MILSEKRGPSADLIANIYLHYSEHIYWLLTGKDEFPAGRPDKSGSNSAHPDVAELFQQTQLASDIIRDLVNLERANPKELEEVKDFVTYRLFKKDLPQKENTLTASKQKKE